MSMHAKSLRVRKEKMADQYVDRDTFSMIVGACPSVGWQVFLALQRIGALSASEALQARWSMMEWVGRNVVLPAEITHTDRERVVPLDPELYAILLDASESARRDKELIVSPEEVDRDCAINRKHLRAILSHVGIKVGGDPLETLRRNAVRDLRAILKDPWAVTTVAGHSRESERKYYLGHVRQSDMARVTGIRGDDGLRVLLDRWPTLTQKAKAAIGQLVEVDGVRSWSIEK